MNTNISHFCGPILNACFAQRLLKEVECDWLNTAFILLQILFYLTTCMDKSMQNNDVSMKCE